MLWYFKNKGQTVTLLGHDTSRWRLELTSVAFPGSTLALRKSSDELSFTHFSEHLSLPCLHSTLFIAQFVVSSSVQGEQDSNPLQNHNCTFHFQLVSIFHPISCQYDTTTVIIRETDHQPCLSLLGETSLDPWAGYCCTKQYRKQLGLNFFSVCSVLTMKTLRVFCLTPVCALPFMGMQKQVMLLHKTISFSAVDTVLVNLEKHTRHLARLVFLWLKTMSYIWSLTPVLLKLYSC